MPITFPPGFFWGAATSAHQVEGGNYYNDNWVMEHTCGSPWVESSGDACDHYWLYPGDLRTMSELGFSLYRFSLEWSRIEPEKGEFSTAALDHYRRMLAACWENSLTPMVTFHHVTTPIWASASGGWNVRETADRFANYCARAMAHLGDLIPWACTLNEVNGPTLALHTNDQALRSVRNMSWFKEAARKAGARRVADFTPWDYAHTRRGRETIMTAHRLGFQAIKAAQPNCKVGLTMAVPDIQAGPGGEKVVAQIRDKILNAFIPLTQDNDFIGVQTYTRQLFDAQGAKLPPEGVELTQMGWEFYPEALEEGVRYVSQATGGLPVFITENGIASTDDKRRIAYLERALRGVAACLRDGIAIKGYIYWSLLDNFEWRQGFVPCFGLVGVDRQTQERTVKQSAIWLGNVARNRGF